MLKERSEFMRLCARAFITCHGCPLACYAAICARLGSCIQIQRMDGCNICIDLQHHLRWLIISKQCVSKQSYQNDVYLNKVQQMVSGEQGSVSRYGLLDTA